VKKGEGGIREGRGKRNIPNPDGEEGSGEKKKERGFYRFLKKHRSPRRIGKGRRGKFEEKGGREGGILSTHNLFLLKYYIKRKETRKRNEKGGRKENQSFPSFTLHFFEVRGEKRSGREKSTEQKREKKRGKGSNAD